MSRTQPNIVVLLPDQLRPDFLGCYGADVVPTPAIDSLAAEGVTFSRAYSSAPICVPARTALQTGLHPLRTGVLDNSQALRPDYAALGIRTWPEILAEHGYTTAAVGKTHFYPWDTRQGFQYRVVAEDKRHIDVRDDYWRFLAENGERKYHGIEHAGYAEARGAVMSKVPWELSIDHFVGAAASTFIRRHADEGPFALFVGFPGPHDPYDPAPAFLDRVRHDRVPTPVAEATDDADMRRTISEGMRQPWAKLDTADFPAAAKQAVRRHYAALIAQIDDEINDILESLRAAGVDDNTVIVLASDHGDCLGDHGYFGKANYFEASTRIPLVVRTPTGGRGVVSDALVDLYDLYPTILTLAGVEVPPMTDAKCLPDPVISGAPSRDAVVGAMSYGWMLRNERYKLHRYYTGEFFLFDIEADPGEQNDLARDGAHQSVLHDMEAQLTAAVMRLTFRGRDELVATSADGYAGYGVFGREGWRREFPLSLGPCGDDADLPSSRQGPGDLWTLGRMTPRGGSHAAATTANSP